ncbi:hypothetical protein, partial [Barnesiella intestinihominis]
NIIKNIERRYAKTQFYQRFLSWNLSLPKRKEEAVSNSVSSNDTALSGSVITIRNFPPSP